MLKRVVSLDDLVTARAIDVTNPLIKEFVQYVKSMENLAWDKRAKVELKDEIEAAKWYGEAIALCHVMGDQTVLSSEGLFDE
jgi:hypothetical protein